MWANIKHALNRSLGTNHFQPLDRIIEIEAYKNFYKNLSLLVNPDSRVHIVDDSVVNLEGILDGGDLLYFDETARYAFVVVVPPSTKKLSDGCFQNFDFGTIYLPPTLIDIGSEVFTGCDALEMVKIPRGVERMADDAFSGATNLKTVLVGWSEGEVAGAPWGLTGDYTIKYNMEI